MNIFKNPNATVATQELKGLLGKKVLAEAINADPAFGNRDGFISVPEVERWMQHLASSPEAKLFGASSAEDARCDGEELKAAITRLNPTFLGRAFRSIADPIGVFVYYVSRFLSGGPG